MNENCIHLLAVICALSALLFVLWFVWMCSDGRKMAIAKEKREEREALCRTLTDSSRVSNPLVYESSLRYPNMRIEMLEKQVKELQEKLNGQSKRDATNRKK